MPLIFPKYNIKILLLGGCNVYLDDSSVAEFSYNKLRALLAYLAVEQGKDHSREFLSELLWSDYDATTARDNLRRALSNLRRALESPSGQVIFSATNHSIRLASNVYVDTVEFAGQVSITQETSSAIFHEETLIALYRGQFLRGLSLPDCPDFEDWLQMQREKLHLRALSLLEKLSNHYAEMNDYSKALQFALRHTELEPWDENGHRKVMHLYALNGQNSSAINQYEICCRLLKNELAVLPNEKTRQLFEEIRNGKFRRRSTDTKSQAIPPVVVERHSPQQLSVKQSSFTTSERRQVTVMYCELLLPTSDDPDELLVELSTLQAHCSEIIQQFSGHIVQTHGGGLIAYFGYPQAHEYAAHRAVRAALAITGKTAVNIEIRTSIHTGLIITDRDISMPDMTGVTSKTAILLRSSVGGGQVAVSKDAHDIITGYFDCISLGIQTLPDIGRSLEVFEVIQESGARSRLEAATHLTTLVGRKTEIAELMALWKETEQGMRRVVLIQGEAGIGKSRLLQCLKAHLKDTPHVIREFRCFPEFTPSPFHPMIAMLEANMGFEHDDAPEVKFEKLVKYVEEHYPTWTQEAVPLFGALLSLPLSGHYQVSGLSPQQQREQTTAILLATLYSLSVQQPVLLIVEDLHWIDPSTLEFLTQFLEQEKSWAILAVFTARPEFDPFWKNALNSTLTLTPLAEEEVVQMITLLNEELSAETIQRIVKRADGVPLFIEEMTKITNLNNQTSIPATLHDLLVMRIDNIVEAKCTAQLAATLGREFDLALLRKISPCSSAILERNLSTLQDAGLVFKINKTTCHFKHALIQEAAYQSQTKTDRQAVHQRIAQVLQSDFPDIVTTQPEFLAQHLSSGGEVRQSIEYWFKAGQRAALKSANLEAIEHFNRGLQSLMTLPPGKDRDRMEFRMLISLCPVLYAAKGYGSEKATFANARISALSEFVGDSEELFQAKWSLVMNTIANVGSREVSGDAMQLLNMAHEDPLKKQAAHYAVADAAFWLGKFEFTRTHTEQAVVLYHPDQHQMLVERFGEDLFVSCLAYLSWTLYFLGYQDQAEQVCTKMLKRARELAHPHTLALALCFSSVLHRWLSKYAETLSLSAETIAISKQHGFSVWLAAGEMTRGWALVMHGQKEEGIFELKSSIIKMRASIGGISVVFLSALIEAYRHLQLYDETLNLIAEAQADAASTGDGHFTAELHRLKGICLLEISEENSEEAEACFNQALVISRKQQAKSLELRAAISMAGLWRQQGKQEDAQRMLKKIYNSFTEGFDNSDLQEAANMI